MVRLSALMSIQSFKPLTTSNIIEAAPHNQQPNTANVGYEAYPKRNFSVLLLLPACQHHEFVAYGEL